MRYGPDDRFWVVLDPSPASTLEDIMFQCSLRELHLQFKGGLRIEKNPTIFTEEQEARIEARTRLIAIRAFSTIAEQGKYFEPSGPLRFVVFDRDDKVVFEADLGK